MEMFGIARQSFTRSMFASDQDKRDDTGLYSLFSTISTRCSKNEVCCRCMYVGNAMLGCIRTDSTFLSRPAAKRKEEKKAERTFAFALE